MEVAISRKRTFLRCNFLNFGYGWLRDVNLKLQKVTVYSDVSQVA